jgi:hypothetical protein
MQCTRHGPACLAAHAFDEEQHKVSEPKERQRQLIVEPK